MTVTIRSKYLDPQECDKPTTRTYWVSDQGGYVYDVTERPGTSGQQVCKSLSDAGDTLYCGNAADLPRIIRRELAARRRDVARR